jgi:general secretion pathway protein G
VLAILGIVVFYAIKPRVGSVRPPARATAAHYDIIAVNSALDAFKVDTGSYPKGSNGLVELVQQSSGATNWHGPYFDPPKLPVDPWGNKYIYEYPGKHNTNGYDLSSAGPDGKAGTEDDIGNWMK